MLSYGQSGNVEIHDHCCCFLVLFLCESVGKPEPMLSNTINEWIKMLYFEESEDVLCILMKELTLLRNNF